METTSSLRDRLSQLTKKQWLLIGGAGVVILLLLAGSGNGSIDPSRPYSCEDLVPDIQKMSTEDGPEIFEINRISEQRGWTEAWPEVSCQGFAETSAGGQPIEFGTSISPQGNVMLNLRYPHGIM